MVIYGEYLFLENLITGTMILHLTAVLSGVKAGKLRLVLGGILCGLYSFILFVPLSVVLALSAKLAFSLTIIFLVFGKSDAKFYGKLVLLFYFISFAMGGITIGFMYFFQVTGISVNGAVYMGSVGYLLIAAFTAAAYIMLTLIVDWMRSLLQENRVVRRVTVGIGGKTGELLGLMDTGNFLQEPFTGRPVFLLSVESLGRLFSFEEAELLRREQSPRKAILALSESSLANRMTLIPYRAVGTEDGLLLGIRPDYIELTKKGEGERMENVILGIYHGTFGKGFAGEPYSILLHPEIVKGGLVCHG